MTYRTENSFSGSYLYLKGENETDEECKYETTGLISFANAYRERNCTYEVLFNLISRISEEGKRLEGAGLDMDGWILDPEYIYVEPPEKFAVNERFHTHQLIRFIYYPGNTGMSMSGGLLYLAEFVIEHAEYKDKDAVEIAYGFYLQIYRGNYVFENLLQ